MTIGIKFPVTGDKNRDHLPWSVVEPHRQEVQKAFGHSLEYLAANGGCDMKALAPCIGWTSAQKGAK